MQSKGSLVESSWKFEAAQMSLKITVLSACTIETCGFDLNLLVSFCLESLPKQLKSWSLVKLSSIAWRNVGQICV